MQKVLVDRNVHRRAITHTTILVPRKVTWGGKEFETPGVIERKRIHPRPDEHFIIEQLPYIASIGEHTRAGNLSLWSCEEINWERVTQPGPNDGWAGFDLLFDIDFEMAASPAERSIIIRAKNSVGLSREEKQEFFRSIRAERFLTLRAAFGDAHIDDTFHLWSAEEAKLNAFITLDRRFLRQFQNAQKRIDFPVQVLTPKELCERLAFQPTDVDQLAAKYPFWR